MPLLTLREAKLLFADLLSGLVIFKVYVFLLPFSAVTTIENLLEPYFSDLVPVPDTLALESCLLAAITVEALFTVKLYVVVKGLKVKLAPETVSDESKLLSEAILIVSLGALADKSTKLVSLIDIEVRATL